MQKWLRQLALCFSAGSVGALAKSGIIWLCMYSAISAGFASHLASAQYPAGMYARIVWGGVAAFLFLLPLASNSWIVRGLLWGVIIAVLQVIAIPLVSHGGMHFAVMPFVWALILSCVWGLATAIALRLFGA
jgi:hypothetical protein